ncbi:MAG: hypothetical protein R3F43_17115 [bacterium]
MADMIIIEYAEKRLYSPRLGIYVLVFEVTCKVSNDLFLLAPQLKMVDLLTGIFARAQQRVGEEDGFDFDFDLYNYYVMSNHLHLLLGVVELVHKSLFLEWTCREIARRVNKFHDRTGQCLIPNKAIQVVSEEHALDRMRYSWPGHRGDEVVHPSRRLRLRQPRCCEARSPRDVRAGDGRSEG